MGGMWCTYTTSYEKSKRAVLSEPRRTSSIMLGLLVGCCKLFDVVQRVWSTSTSSCSRGTSMSG